jgi:hypothetical protein
MRSRASQSQAVLDDVDVECTHCGVRMSTHLGSSTRIRYFHCPSCQRWVSSSYTDVFRADAKLRPRPRAEPAPALSFEQLQDKLDRWLAAIDAKDPYRQLGVSPTDSAERIRERYRELARLVHPDRGGSQERMQQINEAYEKIVSMRERRRQAALGSGISSPQLG